MLWFSENAGNNRSAFIIGIAVALFGCAVTLPAVTHATDTGIGVSVCGSVVPGAVVTITQPASDSVVNQPSVTLRGTIANASQLEISVDGQYSSTISIGSSESTFEFDIDLSTGTHTIGVKANALCGGESAIDSIVITYTPAASEPSTGEVTPTVLDGRTSLDGTVVTTEELKPSDTIQAIEQIPVIGAAVSVVSDFATAIGLESTVINGNAPVTTGVARVGITVAALTTVVMASSLAPVAAQAVPGVSEIFNVSSHRSMLYLGWVIRGVGVLAMALAYFI